MLSGHGERKEIVGEITIRQYNLGRAGKREIRFSSRGVPKFTLTHSRCLSCKMFRLSRSGFSISHFGAGRNLTKITPVFLLLSSCYGGAATKNTVLLCACCYYVRKRNVYQNQILYMYTALLQQSFPNSFTLTCPERLLPSYFRELFFRPLTHPDSPLYRIPASLA